MLMLDGNNIGIYNLNKVVVLIKFNIKFLGVDWM